MLFFGIFEPAVAGAKTPPEAHCHEINVSALNAAEAIRQLASQTGAKLLFAYELAQARRSQAVVGCHSVAGAMEIMLKGSGLKGIRSPKGVFVVVPIGPVSIVTRPQ